MARTAIEHYDRIKRELDKLHADYPESPRVASLHAALGAAWDDYRAAHGDDSEGFENRSGGGDKPPTDPNVPPTQP